jgi:hypothetical protein
MQQLVNKSTVTQYWQQLTVGHLWGNQIVAMEA